MLVYVRLTIAITEDCSKIHDHAFYTIFICLHLNLLSKISIGNSLVRNTKHRVLKCIESTILPIPLVILMGRFWRCKLLSHCKEGRYKNTNVHKTEFKA